MLAYLIGVKTIDVGIKPWFLIFCWFFHESYQFFDVFELTRTKSLLFWKLKKNQNYSSYFKNQNNHMYIIG